MVNMTFAWWLPAHWQNESTAVYLQFIYVLVAKRNTRHKFVDGKQSFSFAAIENDHDRCSWAAEPTGEFHCQSHIAYSPSRNSIISIPAISTKSFLCFFSVNRISSR